MFDKVVVFVHNHLNASIFFIRPVYIQYSLCYGYGS